jgi:hypothetical protein
VLNGLVLVSYISPLRGEGASVGDAVIRSCEIRLRAVLMTASIAIFSLIPMVYVTGPGSEIQRPLAVTKLLPSRDATDVGGVERCGGAVFRYPHSGWLCSSVYPREASMKPLMAGCLVAVGLFLLCTGVVAAVFYLVFPPTSQVYGVEFALLLGGQRPVLLARASGAAGKRPQHRRHAITAQRRSSVGRRRAGGSMRPARRRRSAVDCADDRTTLRDVQVRSHHLQFSTAGWCRL